MARIAVRDGRQGSADLITDGRSRVLQPNGDYNGRV